MVLTKQSIYTDIFTLFYNTLNDNIASPRSSPGARWIFPDYPANKIENTENYPMVVIEGPDLDYDDFTFTENEFDGEVRIHVLAAGEEASKKLDELNGKVLHAIETTTKSVWESNGIEKIKMNNNRRDRFTYGAVRGKLNEQTWNFQVYLDKVTDDS